MSELTYRGIYGQPEIEDALARMKDGARGRRGPYHHAPHPGMRRDLPLDALRRRVSSHQQTIR